MKKVKSILLIFSVVLFVFLGCTKQVIASAQQVVPPPKQEVDRGTLSSPESVAYDSTNEILYVSNNTDDGYISKMDLDGKVVEASWVRGLVKPRGMAVFKEMLYVSCPNELVEINISSGTITNRYPATFDNGNFNDVAIDARNGDVYISHTRGNMIYRLSEGSFTKWLQHEDLQHPNGLYVDTDSNQLVVASVGKVTDFSTWATDPDGHIQTVSLSDKTIGNIGDGAVAIGFLDGVQKIGSDYYVTDWKTGELSRVNSSGSETVITSLADSSVPDRPKASDFVYIPKINKFFIPMAAYNKIEIFTLPNSTQCLTSLLLDQK